MSKSELLAKEIPKEDIQQLEKRIDENSILINELTNKLVNDYCKNLDDYILFIHKVLQDDKQPPTAQELDDFVMNLPVLLYFCR